MRLSPAELAGAIMQAPADRVEWHTEQRPDGVWQYVVTFPLTSGAYTPIRGAVLAELAGVPLDELPPNLRTRWPDRPPRTP